jgi:CRP-like cAMP-binding protein
MKKISCQDCSNHDCLVQQHCSEEWIARIDKSKYQLTFKEGQNIIHEGMPVRGIYFIQAGKVKVLSTGLDGRPQIVRFASAGHILGHKGLGIDDVYPISAVAMETGLLCFISNEMLYDVFLNNPKFTYGLMMFYSRELRKVESRLKNIALMNLREKIAEVLLLVMENFGLNRKNEFDVHLGRKDIADAAGTTVEQVSRMLTQFEQEKLISRNGRKIAILDQDGLNHIISAQNCYQIKE